MSKQSTQSLQPLVQLAAKRLEYLIRRRNTGIRKKSRHEVFMYWLESEKSSIEILSKKTSLRDISSTARRLLWSYSNEELAEHGGHGKKLLLQWMAIEKPKETTKASLLKESQKTDGILKNSFKPQNLKSHQLVESKNEVESWLLLLAIHILWKKESKCTHALELCSKAIDITSKHINDILILSPKSHLEKEENAEKVMSLKKIASILKTYEALIAQECVSSYLGKNDDTLENDSTFKTTSSSADDTPKAHKQTRESLQRRMEYNKKRLESLNKRLDFKANMINFNLIDPNNSTDNENEKSKCL